MTSKHIKQIQQVTLVSVLCSFPVSVDATPLIPILTISPTEHQLVAQAFVDDRCPDEYVYVLGSTRNYEVIICGERDSGTPTHYLGVSRRNSSSILLPLSAYTESRFFARNGQYTYTLDLNTQTLTLGIPGRRPIVERFTPESP